MASFTWCNVGSLVSWEAARAAERLFLKTTGCGRDTSSEFVCALEESKHWIIIFSFFFPESGILFAPLIP